MQDQGAGYLLPAYGKLNVQLWMLLSKETMTPISAYLWRWGIVAVHPVCSTTQACHTCLQGEGAIQVQKYCSSQKLSQIFNISRFTKLTFHGCRSYRRPRLD